MVCDLISLQTTIEKSFSYAIAYGAWRDNVKFLNHWRPKLSLWGVTIFFFNLYATVQLVKQDRPCTLLHGPIERYLYRSPREHCYDKPIKNLPMGPWSKVHGLPWTVRSLPALNCALPSPGQGQFVSPAIRSGFECVHRWSQQHDLSARMASFLRFTAL